MIYLKIWIITLLLIICFWGFAWFKMDSKKPTKINWYKIAKISGIIMILLIVVPFIIVILVIDL